MDLDAPPRDPTLKEIESMMETDSPVTPPTKDSTSAPNSLISTIPDTSAQDHAVSNMGSWDSDFSTSSPIISSSSRSLSSSSSRIPVQQFPTHRDDPASLRTGMANIINTQTCILNFLDKFLPSQTPADSDKSASQ